MLNLQPPYLDVGNIRVYKDDKDPSVFYYITQKPRLAIGDSGKPAISAYALIPESGAGKENDSILETALTLDVDLHITRHHSGFQGQNEGGHVFNISSCSDKKQWTISVLQ